MAVTFEVNREPAKEIRIACIKCAGKTIHSVLAEVSEAGSEEHHDWSFDWSKQYQIAQCRGCMSVSYRDRSTNSEEYDYDDDGNPYSVETENVYPPRVEGARGLGDDVYLLPREIRRIYEETRAAMAGQTPVLAGIGLRVLLETVCKAKKAKGRGLLAKVDALVEERVLTPDKAAILHKIRTLGNAAAHEATPHTNDQLKLALDIMENLLQDVYVLPERATAAFKAPAAAEPDDE